MKVFDYLIGARFFTTMGNCTALLVLFDTIENTVQKGLEDGESEVQAMVSVNFSLAFGFVAIIFDFIGMFWGHTLFSPTINVLQVFFHAAGGIFLSWLITQNWHYEALWPIIICTNFPTAIIEIAVILSIYIFKMSAL